MRSGTAAMLLVLNLLWSPTASADLCINDATMNGKGVPVKWLTSPIKYYINASRLPVAQQAAAVTAVQAAFAAWTLPCTRLQFTYAGASTATAGVSGAIIVYWGDDATSWAYGQNAYFYGSEWTSTTTGEMSKGMIGMNARDYIWSVGAVPLHIDIQTAVTWMLPGALGFYVGTDPVSGSLPIKFNEVKTVLTQEHKDGASYLYFKADPGCTQAPPPAFCALATTPADGGPLKDAGVPADASPDKLTGADKSAVSDLPGHPDGPRPDAPLDQGSSEGSPARDAGVDLPVPVEQGLADGALVEGGATADLGPLAPPLDDGGCCRVVQGPVDPPSLLVLIGSLALLLLRRRRR